MNQVRTIAQEWGGFSKQVFGDRKPSDAQYTAMRQAFYGGAMIMFGNLLKLVEQPNPDELMTGFSQEIDAFVLECFTNTSKETLEAAFKEAVARRRAGL